MPKPAQKTSPARSARPAKAKPGAKPGAKPKAKVQRKAKAVSVAGVKADAGLPVDRVSVGDCLEHMAAWPEDSVDLVFADPPYNIGWQYDQYRDKRPGDEYVQWTEDWITAVARVLKPTGSFYLLIGDEYAAEARMHLKKLERDKQLQFRNWVIWHYTFGQNCKTKFNRSHAHLFYCVGSAACSHKGKAADAPYTFNRQAIAVPSARQTTYADARANPAGKMPDDLWLLRPQEGMAVQPEAIEEPSRPSKKRSGLRKNVNGASSDRSEGSAGLGADGDSGASGDFGGGFRGYFRPEEDVWYLSRLCGTFKERLGWHPCQLPEALLERVVKLSSNQGDVVLDPFVGSGTTLAVAAKLGRRWLGCELSPDYAERATQRVEHIQQTGESVATTFADKGIERGKPKKKAEPHRSPHLRGGPRNPRQQPSTSR